MSMYVCVCCLLQDVLDLGLHTNVVLNWHRKNTHCIGLVVATSPLLLSLQVYRLTFAFNRTKFSAFFLFCLFSYTLALLWLASLIYCRCCFALGIPWLFEDQHTSSIYWGITVDLFAMQFLVCEHNVETSARNEKQNASKDSQKDIPSGADRYKEKGSACIASKIHIYGIPIWRKKECSLIFLL